MDHMAVVESAHTPDGKYRVYRHEDQTAELCEIRGKSNITMIGRSPLYVIMGWLVEHSYEELIKE